MKRSNAEQGEAGFTLVELLITIVVVGIVPLAAVAILGIAGLTQNGSAAACNESMDAAKAATTLHYSNTGTYPQAFTDMTGTTPREFEVPTGVSEAATTLKNGTHWTLTMTPNGATNVTTYVCS